MKSIEVSFEFDDVSFAPTAVTRLDENRLTKPAVMLGNGTDDQCITITEAELPAFIANLQDAMHAARNIIDNPAMA
jgi:hypothetical protein